MLFLPRSCARHHHPLTGSLSLPISTYLRLRRSFVSFPGSSSSSETHQSLHAKRTLPYRPAQLYTLIADIEAYPSFLPYCTSASILTRTPPDHSNDAPHGHPRTAALTVGWSSFQESFVSRVYCVPGKVVEAVSGEGQTGIPRRELPRVYGEEDMSEGGAPGSVFQSLRTRWEVKGEGAGSSEVELNIEARWSNTLLAAMSQRAAPRVADRVVEAFEARAREVLG